MVCSAIRATLDVSWIGSHAASRSRIPKELQRIQEVSCHFRSSRLRWRPHRSGLASGTIQECGFDRTCPSVVSNRARPRRSKWPHPICGFSQQWTLRPGVDPRVDTQLRSQVSDDRPSDRSSVKRALIGWLVDTMARDAISKNVWCNLVERSGSSRLSTISESEYLRATQFLLGRGRERPA